MFDLEKIIFIKNKMFKKFFLVLNWIRKRALRIAGFDQIIGYVELVQPSAISGWVIQRACKQIQLSLRIREREYFLIPEWIERTDIAQKYGKKFLKSGFYCKTSSEISNELTLLLQANELIAVFANGTRLKNIPMLRKTILQNLLQEGTFTVFEEIFNFVSQEDVKDTKLFNTFILILLQKVDLGEYTKIYELLNKKESFELFSSFALERLLLLCLASCGMEIVDRINVKEIQTAFFEYFNNLKLKQDKQRQEHLDLILIKLNKQLMLYFGKQNLTSVEKEILQKTATVFAHWTYQLKKDRVLALSFFDMLTEVPKIDWFNNTERTLFLQLNRLAERNVKAFLIAAEMIRNQTNSWYAYHECAVLYHYFLRNQFGLGNVYLKTAIELFQKANALNTQQCLSQFEAWGLLQEFYDLTLTKSMQVAGSGDITTGVVLRQNRLLLLIQCAQSLQNQISRINYIKKSSKTLLLEFKDNSSFLNEIENLPVPISALQNIQDDNNTWPWTVLNSRKLLFWGSRSLFQCYYYRIREKIEQIESLGFEASYLDISEMMQVDWKFLLMGVGILFACRVPSCLNEIKLFVYAKALGIPIVYDIDDLIFDAEVFPPPLETYAGTIDKLQHIHLTLDNPFFKMALTFADHCIVSTQPLAEEIIKHVSDKTQITILPNLLSYEVMLQIRLHENQQLKNNNDVIKIFYGSATKAHKLAFYEILLPAVLKVLKKYSNVRLNLIGYFTNLPEIFLNNGQIKLLEPTSDFLSYLQIVSQQDINIAILEKSRITDTKSEIKWLEAAAFKIPSVVSPTATYRQVLKNDEHVLFAETTQQWQDQLDRLINSSTLRAKIGHAAYALALEKFNPTIGENILSEVIKYYWNFAFDSAVNLTIHNNNQSINYKKKRILFVNIYFAPQSIGGATRIMETQVRGLKELYDKEYEIFVLTTYAEPHFGLPYSIDQYWYEDILVTRINIPLKDWSEFKDEKVEKFCETFFKIYCFDLIHLHSVQVLTASIITAALRSRIPFIVTLHDAWWMSRYMFLIDQNGLLIDHTDPFDFRTQSSFAEKNQLSDAALMNRLLERKRILKNLLKEASAILAVSEKFAILYRESGIQNVSTLDNISEPFNVIQRQRANHDPIVIGFLGGISHHKGYYLFKNIIETNDFPFISILVVDHGLNPGEQYQTNWGATAVQFIAKCKQTEIGQLYAQMDVLVAPSLWPESYGLVTREALQAGVWVIASKRGAIGDCVIEGVNGNLIDVADENSFILAIKNLPDVFASYKREPQIKLDYAMLRQQYIDQLVYYYRKATNKII